MMAADPLTEAISGYMPVKHVAGALNLGGRWAIAFRKHDGFKCLAVAEGEAWLRVKGEPDALLLATNDCVLLPNGRPFVVARDLSFTAVDFENIPTEEWHEQTATIGDGRDATLLVGHFAFSGLQSTLMLGGVGSIVRLRDEDRGARLRWLLNQMKTELAEPCPGSLAAVRLLANLLLVQALRLFLAAAADRPGGWLFALHDAKIGKAVVAIHDSPSTRWTLSDLAAVSNMSRSRFAERFRRIVGMPPLDYLTHWRMMIACQRLETTREPVGSIATGLGYQSESAFNTAFKRILGCSPGRFRKAHRRVRDG